ncbi:hypothetical protein H2201_001049 [Coniosporium apollinis]|uniref:Zn(2)-C6 fungal-type domain-containing protein n=1 Tax=Coniosporium apollinis TaxID=61459 RepID=A0ABQ9P3F3_9PEZI|nr:hypothetical protein H2201_001049 [Coniosporium apollinis]
MDTGPCRFPDLEPAVDLVPGLDGAQICGQPGFMDGDLHDGFFEPIYTHTTAVEDVTINSADTYLFSPSESSIGFSPSYASEPGPWPGYDSSTNSASLSFLSWWDDKAHVSPYNSLDSKCLGLLDPFEDPTGSTAPPSVGSFTGLENPRGISIPRAAGRRNPNRVALPGVLELPTMSQVNPEAVQEHIRGMDLSEQTLLWGREYSDSFGSLSSESFPPLFTPGPSHMASADSSIFDQEGINMMVLSSQKFTGSDQLPQHAGTSFTHAPATHLNARVDNPRSNASVPPRRSRSTSQSSTRRNRATSRTPRSRRVTLENQSSASGSGPVTGSQSCSVEFVQYRMNGETQALEKVGEDYRLGPRRGGRIGPLALEQRKSTALVRDKGACKSCKKRKCKCDLGVPCYGCFKSLGPTLIHQRCRGGALKDLADRILSHGLGWHPTPRTLNSFLQSTFYRVSDDELTVPLILDFGPPLPIQVRVISVNSTDWRCLFHDHAVYHWPPRGRAEAEIHHHPVFPAKLSNLTDLRLRLDHHLALLVDQHFNKFPLYPSQFHVLKEFYLLYRRISRTEPARSRILQQALKLLVLVHISGDARIDLTDPTAQRIISRVLPGGTGANAKPCFIRGELGSVMPDLARELMSEVLSRLEVLFLDQDCVEWPIVISTVGVLLMTIESVQYHSSRVGYHSSPVSTSGELQKTQCQMMDEQAIVILLNFYGMSYPICHTQLQEGSCGSSVATSSTASNANPSIAFVSGVRRAISDARQYLQHRLQMPAAKAGDIAYCFDHWLAKLFLSRPSLTGSATCFGNVR